MRYVLGVLFSGLLVTPLMSAPVVDGTKDAVYGSPLSIQTVETSFGNNLSEWDAGYGLIEGGKLYLMLTGNVQDNFNKLEIFIDSKAGGQSVFDSSGNDDAGRMDGLVFDAGFTADYHIIARRGTDGFNDKFDLDFANLGAQSASGYFDFMSGGGKDGTGTTGTGVNSVAIQVGYDNSNVAGIGDDPNLAADQVAAAAVLTGLELGIDLGDLGYTGGPIRVMVGQNGDGHHYWSNQFLGGLPAPQGNLGGDEAGNFTGEGAIDMTHFAGNQYFTVNVPEPSTLFLVAIAASPFVTRRRKTIPQDRT
jgi:hypothetical protein